MIILSTMPSNDGLVVVLTAIVVLVVLIGVGLAFRWRNVLRKHVKIVVAAIFILVATVAVIGGLWYAEASIDYWFVSSEATATQDNFLTIYCENTGHLAATFDLELAFTNAHFSLKTSLPYQFIDNRTAKFTFTLQPGEIQSRQAWFIIDDDVSDFYVSLSFQQNGANFLVRSSSGGVNSVSYQKDFADSNFTMRTFAPPP